MTYRCLFLEKVAGVYYSMSLDVDEVQEFLIPSRSEYYYFRLPLMLLI